MHYQIILPNVVAHLPYIENQTRSTWFSPSLLQSLFSLALEEKASVWQFFTKTVLQWQLLSLRFCFMRWCSFARQQINVYATILYQNTNLNFLNATNRNEKMIKKHLAPWCWIAKPFAFHARFECVILGLQSFRFIRSITGSRFIKHGSIYWQTLMLYLHNVTGLVEFKFKTAFLIWSAIVLMIGRLELCNMCLCFSFCPIMLAHMTQRFLRSRHWKLKLLFKLQKT